MRQRLLLVAGWATAAVVASLVSTGAVAVAGGQVTDRPLRPLSASEVAALTEECGLSERAPCLRQLDEATDPTTTVTAAPESNSSLEGGEQGVSPNLPTDTSTTAVPGEPGSDDSGTLVPGDDFSGLPLAKSDVATTKGGSVGIVGTAGEVRVLWVIPSPGFALLPATGGGLEPGTVRVVFSDGSHQSTVTAAWSDEEGLVVETKEGAIDQTEG
jgi:hypothetical protein